MNLTKFSQNPVVVSSTIAVLIVGAAVGACRLRRPHDTGGSFVAAPVVRQLTRSDCGLAVLATLLADLGKPRSMADLGKGVAMPEQGLSMLTIQQLASRNSLTLLGVRSRNKRALQWRLPWIAHLSSENWQHYVLVEHVLNDEVIVADPAVGRIAIRSDDFYRLWSGNALVFAN